MTDPTPATGHEVAPPLTVITAPTGVTAAQVRVLGNGAEAHAPDDSGETAPT